MSEETKNAAELTDKQLEKVAGGEGIGEKTFIVINPKGASIYAFPKESRQFGTYPYKKVLHKCSQLGEWVFVPNIMANEGVSGYVLMSDLLERIK